MGRWSSANVILAVVTFALYLDLVRWFPLVSLIDVPLQDLGKLTGYGAPGLYRYVAILTGLYVLYLVIVALSLTRRTSSTSLWFTGGAPLLFAGTLVFLYPIGGLDLFDYVAHARVWLVYGQNPFSHVMAEHPDDPLFRLMGWVHAPAAYGGLWMWLSAPAAWLEPVLAPVLYFKVLALAAFGASLALVRAIVARVAPPYRDAAMLFYGWNPLVLTESTGNGHNDVVMMAPALAAIYCFVARSPRLAPVLMAAASAVKFVTAALWPLLILALVGRSRGLGAKASALVLATLSSVLVVALTYAPFWASDVDVLTLERRKRMFTASPAAVLQLWLVDRVGEAAAQDTARQIATVLFGMIALAIFLTRAPNVPGLLRSSYWLLFAYLCVAAIWFQPWYLIWLVSLAAIVPSTRIWLATIVFTVSAQWNYVVFDYLWIWWNSSPAALEIQALVVGGIFGPPLMVAAIAMFFGRGVDHSLPKPLEHA